MQALYKNVKLHDSVGDLINKYFFIDCEMNANTSTLM